MRKTHGGLMLGACIAALGAAAMAQQAVAQDAPEPKRGGTVFVHMNTNKGC